MPRLSCSFFSLAASPPNPSHHHHHHHRFCIQKGNGVVQLNAQARLGAHCLRLTSGGFLRIPQPSIRSSTYTMMAWVRLASANPSTPMVVMGEWTRNAADRSRMQYSMLLVDDSGQTVRDMAGVSQAASVDLTDLEWHHVVSVRADARRELWVDGKLLDAVGGGLVSDGPLASLFIGANGADSSGAAVSPFDGWVDDVRFYTRGLDQDEIRTIFGKAFCTDGKEFFTSSSDCQAYTRCHNGEYEAQAPTASSDRICTICPAGSVVSPDDGKCRPCPPGTHTPAGSVGVCADFRCPAGSADADSNSTTPCEACKLGVTVADATGQTQCRAVKVCPAGTEPELLPTTAMDTRCRACPIGTFKGSVGNAACSALLTCAPGEYEVVSPTQEINRACAPCDGVTSFASPANITACQPATVCDFGEEEVAALSPSSDRKCSKCSAGTFKATRGSSTTCASCLESCAAGMYLVPCAGNTTGLTANAECRPCPAGTYTPAAGNQTACLPQRLACEAEQYIAQPATPTSDAGCAACATCKAGEYILGGCSNGIENRACATCPTTATCGDGSFVSGTCDPKSTTPPQCQTCDPRCATCEGRASSCTSCPAALAYHADTKTCVSDCDSKQYNDTTGGNHECKACAASCKSCFGGGEDQCLTCPGDAVLHKGRCLTDCTGVEGLYAEDGRCRPCTICPALGTYESVPCTATADRACAAVTACDPGFYETAMPSGTSNRICAPCSVCAAGKYATAGGCVGTSDTKCVSCTLHESYQPKAGQSSCLPVQRCRAGTERTPATLTTNAACKTCPTGSTDDDADPGTACTPCGPGTYVMYGSVGSCENHRCMPGTADKDARADRLCHACNGVTEYQPAAGQTQCLAVPKCMPGTRRVAQPTWTTPGVCTPCVLGFEYQNAVDAGTCKPVTSCAAATYETAAPTTTSNRACTAWQSCGAQMYQAAPGTPTSDTDCRPLTSCSSDEIEVTVATKTSDRVCHAYARLYFNADFKLVADAGDGNVFQDALRQSLRALAYPFQLSQSDFGVTLSEGSIVATLTSADKVSRDAGRGSRASWETSSASGVRCRAWDWVLSFCVTKHVKRTQTQNTSCMWSKI